MLLLPYCSATISTTFRHLILKLLCICWAVQRVCFVCVPGSGAASCSAHFRLAVLGTCSTAHDDCDQEWVVVMDGWMGGCVDHTAREQKKIQKVIWKWNLNSILSPYFGQRTSWLRKTVPLWAVLSLSCRFQSSGAPVIRTKKNKSMISEVIVGRWTSLVSSYVCSSPQEECRAINSMITQQIPYSPCDRNKHTLLPAWTCPFRINAPTGGHALIILVQCILWIYTLVYSHCVCIVLVLYGIAFKLLVVWNVV